MATRKAKTQTLTDALAHLLQKRLLPDLTERAAQPSIKAALERQYNGEKQRTADSLREFTERTLEQVGAAWILSCVFVRTLEDRGLLARNRLAGEGAEDSEQLFFELAPSLTARDYLLTVFQEVASLPGAEDVLGVKHNAAFKLSPSNDGARALLDFFRERDASGGLCRTFAGEDTRFLGDLYQDLSEQVRKRYALLQTPDFVESFILDHTLEPAIAEYGLEQVRIIDPTCGSGHFLLGAFQRLLDQRLRTAPGVDVREHALAALGQVYGVDVNPYAVAIARFRLTLAYLARCGFTQLAQAPKLQLNLVVADSLLHGAKDISLLFAEHESAHGDEAAWDAQLFALDEPEAARRVFGQSYHAVVGNPPYITPKDAALRDAYRNIYKSCHREYALAAPFTERFFHLAVEAGFVGMINANSFTKREFGKPLIEQVLRSVDLTQVIDSSGAYIPGHGTPTVMLFGRNRKPVDEQVSVVLGKRGEPTPPNDPEQGCVWRSIADCSDKVGFDNEYISVVKLPRRTLWEHPWSLGGGGVSDLVAKIGAACERTLASCVTSIGLDTITRASELLELPRETYLRVGVEDEVLVDYPAGEDIRDWVCRPEVVIPVAYDRASWKLLEISSFPGLRKHLWPHRFWLANRFVSGGTRMSDVGRPYWGIPQLPVHKHRIPMSIAFAFVATHNHFALDRGGKVFNRTAPIIKLPESASEDDHLALLAYLNSSTACFWMKQVFFDKGGGGIGGGLASAEWEKFYEFDGTKLRGLPVPSLMGNPVLAPVARRIEALADQRATLAGGLRFNEIVAASASLDDVRLRLAEDAKVADHILDQLVYLQEELDWWTYANLGLAPKELGSDLNVVDIEPKQSPARGSRPFLVKYLQSESPRREIERLFEFCGMSQTDVVAEGGRPSVQALWRQRAAFLESASSAIPMLEKPEYKRTLRDAWRIPSVEDRANHQLLEMAEQTLASALAVPHPVRWLAGRVSSSQTGQITSALTGNGEGAVQKAVSRACVPHLVSQRFTPAGFAKHAEWKKAWNLQRREDLGESVGTIPVPPKYDSKDFQSVTYWQLRGKLDVPKERFISYPGCEKDGDPSPLIGWAGWNHLQRAQALIALYQERKTEDGWPAERLMPMLVGLHELMFWLELWHSAPEAGSQNPAREFKQYLDAELSAHRLTVSDLEAWRPPAKKKAKAAKKAG